MKSKKSKKKCEHAESYSECIDDDGNIYGDFSEGGDIYFFLQCDECGQKMRINARITLIEEEKEE